MMIQRTRSGSTAKATVSAGNAMLTVESRDTKKAAAAAIHRVHPRYGSARLAGLRKRPRDGPPGRGFHARAATVQPDAMPLEPGAVHEVSRTVTPDLTA